MINLLAPFVIGLSPAWGTSPGCHDLLLYEDEIVYWSEHWSEVFNVELDPDLAASVACIESGGNRWYLTATAYGDYAIGVFQIRRFHLRPGDNPFDANTNIEHGTRVLAWCMANAGSVEEGLVWYTAGEDPSPRAREAGEYYSRIVLALFNDVR